jgi:uncharacterized Zn finger protein
VFSARLLAGEMPREIDEAFRAARASLFPARPKDVDASCTCPDWANPCKHVAAVRYLLGERFDADPFLMFELRGRGKDEIIAELRSRRAGGAVEEPESAAAQTEAEAESAPALSESLGAFWSAPEGVPDTAVSGPEGGFGFGPPPVDALPVKRLGAPAFWSGEGDFAALMVDAYRSVAAHGRRVLLGEG